ncbi:uncharacterized protein C19orf44 homolog [Cyrtonyx montezumae]|uniref:uncharacterized protein C19orf44 homolog n=1 Tax=Cyrtonyx montezumae TaxID=9017 RepID=UPI0032DB76F9
MAAAGGAPLGRSWVPGSGEGRGHRRGAEEGGAAVAPRSASHARCSSALRRAVQLQSRILQRAARSAGLGREPLDEDSSSDCAVERRAGGKGCLEGPAAASRSVAARQGCPGGGESTPSLVRNTAVTQRIALESDEKRMGEFVRNSLEFSSGKEIQKCVPGGSRWGGKSRTPVSLGTPPPLHKEISLTEISEAPSVHSRDSEKNALGGSNLPRPPPGSRNLSAQRGVRSQALSSSVKDNTVKITLSRRGNIKESQVSRGSEIKSLDDLFSKADDVEESTSMSSNDFRQNILSLDDLASEISEAAELKLQGTDVQSSQESNKNPKKETLLMEKEQTFPKRSAEIGAADTSEGDTENMSAAEISEHLGEVSADFSGHRQDYPDHDDSSFNTEYSEDFEQSLSATDKEAVSEMLEEHSESGTYSGKGPSSSASSPLLGRDRHKGLHTVAVKESAVQTVDPPFTYCWSKTHSSALRGPPVGSSYVDPVPIAPHVVGTDTLEALTAYSPSVLALNAMLKQHLMLTQQFVENVRHLHFSLVESLENEKFHYHTLEEAKEYIRKHRSPPLKFEEVFEEMQKAEGILLPS